MASYIIQPAVSAINKQLSTAQRSSSLFSEAPMICGKILRRGTQLVLDEAKYELNKAKISMLVDAGSIKVTVQKDEGSDVKVDVQVDQKEIENLANPVIDEIKKDLAGQDSNTQETPVDSSQDAPKKPRKKKE